MGPSRVNFRVGTLSTKQRVSSRWSNEVPLKMPPRHLTALSGNAASSRKRGEKREAGTSASVNSWGGLFRSRTISSPNRIRTFNPFVNSRRLTSGEGSLRRADRDPEPNRFEPLTRQSTARRSSWPGLLLAQFPPQPALLVPVQHPSDRPHLP